MNLKVLNNGGSLSETDLQLISGTELLMQMMRNRRLIMASTKDDINWEVLMNGIQGLYHIRRVEGDKLYQIWFEVPGDIVQFEKNLYMVKLGRKTDS